VPTGGAGKGPTEGARVPAHRQVATAKECGASPTGRHVRPAVEKARIGGEGHGDDGDIDHDHVR
jgi:hypothetical protein